MTQLIRAENRFADRRAQSLTRAVHVLRYGNAASVPRSAASAANLRLVASFLPDLVQKARYESHVPSSAPGQPSPDWIMPLMNLLGDEYAANVRDTRAKLAAFFIDFLESLSADNARAHVRRMRSPALIRDVLVNRPSFCPDISDQSAFLTTHTVASLEKEPVELLNTFWTCVTVTQQGPWVEDRTRRWYYDAFPKLLDETLDFVAAEIETSARVARGRTYSEAVAYALRERYDRALSDSIRTKMAMREWLTL